MYTPSIEIKCCKELRPSGLFLTLNGNTNIVLRILTELGFDNKYMETRYSSDTMHKLVWYLADGAAGTKKGIGRVGDITKIGSYKLNYVMITKDKDKPIPEEGEVYNRKLVKPNQLVVFTREDGFKIDMTVEYNQSSRDYYLNMKLYNVPEHGITIPNTLTDGITNWLCYWFSNEAVARRHVEPRGKKTMFKGHHGISDIYITRDLNTGNDVLVYVFNDKNPSKYIIFSRQDHPNYGEKVICVHEYDVVNNTTIQFYVFDRYTGGYEIINTFNTEEIFEEYRIKSKNDTNAFLEYFHKWVSGMHVKPNNNGGTYYV